MGPERRALGLALALLCCAHATAQDDVVGRLQEHLAAARYGEGLRETEALEDRALAAEWRSYLYAQAGDLTASLREARLGLQLAPRNAGLLTQALNACLSLGLSDEASALSARLVDAAGEAGDAALVERAARLQGFAGELVARQELAARSVARARTVALAGITGALAALLLLARRGAREAGET